jgi:hypothetical protein
MAREMSTTLTRRQMELVKHLNQGGRIDAAYMGGDATDVNNWEFSIYHADDGTIEGCSPSARALINLRFARFAIPDHLGYHYVVGT